MKPLINLKERGMVPKAAAKESMVMKASKKKGYVRRRTDPIIKKCER